MAEAKGKKEPNPSILSRIFIKLKTTKDKKIRSKMVQALGKLQKSWLLPVLLEGLNDPSEEVREKIILGLVSWENLPWESLCSRLKNQPWYVKTAILQVLGRRKEIKSISAVASAIDDPNVEVRRQVALCLGRIAEKEALPFLVKLLKDSNPYVRQAAQEALSRASRLRFT